MRQLYVYLLVLCVYGKMPEAYDCDILRQHGVLTPRCKARYIVNEGKEPLVIDNDEDSSLIEFKQRRAPLPLHKRESQLVDSNDCTVESNDGNWLMNLFSNLYRQFVMCDALKLKQLPLPEPASKPIPETRSKPLSNALPTIDFDTNDMKPQIRRAPARKLPNPPKLPSAKLPEFSTISKPTKPQFQHQLEQIEQPKPTHQFEQIQKPKSTQQKPTKKSRKLRPKKTQLNERYRNVETIRWHDPLEKFHATEQQKHIDQKLQFQPTILTRSTFQTM